MDLYPPDRNNKHALPSHPSVMAEEKYKIVVFGAFGAGKSTLVQALDPQAKHIEAKCAGGTTTIAFNTAGCRSAKKSVLYGTPGQERFEFAREIIGKGMDGAILLVDVTCPVNEFVEHLYTSIIAARIPYVVLLNKCDAVGAQPDAAKAHFAGAETKSYRQRTGARPRTHLKSSSARPGPTPAIKRTEPAGMISHRCIGGRKPPAFFSR